jgi:ribosome maturation factor RimP
MSGNSRHGSVRPPGTAAGQPGTGRPAAGQAGSGQPRSGPPESGQTRSNSYESGQSGSAGRAPGARPLPPIDADRVAGVLEPVIRALDLDLEGIRITAAGRRRVLRLVVDGDGGVSLDAIARASRELSAVLDDSEVMGDLPYVLEVSSPGVDRPLTERRHWRRAIGRLVAAPLTAGPAGSAPAGADARDADARDAEGEVIEGRVTGASADGITLDVDGESRQFGYGDLGPGRIKIEFARLADADEDDIAETDELSADDEPSADELSADKEGLNGY